MTTAHAQPEPRDRRLVVVYDGNCPFCRRQARRIQQRDVDDQFEYLPRQAENIEQRFPQLAEGDFNSGMRLIHRDGRVSVGADAVYHIARRVRRWRYFAWLYRVPILHQIFRGLYALIARNRLRLSKACTDDTCEL